MVKTFTLRKELILIELKHISKVYEGANRVEALKDINLDVKEGEIFGIIGQSGAGKSTLINSLAGSAATRTANKAGHTRGQQWVKIGKNLELLDTPGVLWPKLEDQRAAARLAMTGAVSDDVYDLEHVMKQLLNHLLTNTPNILVERYKLKEEEMTDVDTILESIGRRRGCLVSGGVVDFDKARRIILQDYRNTKLGTITLDKVDEEPYYPENGEDTQNG